MHLIIELKEINNSFNLILLIGDALKMGFMCVEKDNFSNFLIHPHLLRKPIWIESRKCRLSTLSNCETKWNARFKEINTFNECKHVPPCGRIASAHCNSFRSSCRVQLISIYRKYQLTFDYCGIGSIRNVHRSKAILTAMKWFTNQSISQHVSFGKINQCHR